MQEITIKGDFIRLDALLKYASLVSSGGEAKLRIAAGEISVNGETCTQRGKKCRDGDRIQMDSRTILIKCS